MLRRLEILERVAAKRTVHPERVARYVKPALEGRRHTADVYFSEGLLSQWKTLSSLTGDDLVQLNSSQIVAVRLLRTLYQGQPGDMVCLDPCSPLASRVHIRISKND